MQWFEFAHDKIHFLPQQSYLNLIPAVAVEL